VESKSIPWDHVNVKLKHLIQQKKAGGKTKPLASFFLRQPTTGQQRGAEPAVDEGPFAVILLKAKDLTKSTLLSKIAFGKDQVELPITAEIEAIIQSHAVDAVVWGESYRYDTCNVFDRMLPQLQGKGKYILHDYVRKDREVEVTVPPPVTLPQPRPPPAAAQPPRPASPSRQTSGTGAQQVPAQPQPHS
jgi:hypothetical protein